MIDQHLQLFASLNRHNVEYLLIGGTLAIAYGVPRVTKDIDLFLKPSLENAGRCLTALKEIGMGTAELTTPEEICKMEVTIFKDFLRVDLLTRVKGLEFDESWKGKTILTLDKVEIPALSVEDLIRSKKAAARSGDLEDIKILEMARNSQPTLPPLKDRVIEVLQTCYDPEIPVNIYELGLIYDVTVGPANDVSIRMTLTSPACPVAGSLPPEVEAKVKQISGVGPVKVEVVWDPPWSPEKMSEAARLQLRMM